MLVIGHMAGHNGRVLCPGEKEVLFDLVAADVAEDPPVLGFPVKPVRSFFRRPQTVGPHPHDLEHAADAPLLDEPGSADGAFRAEPFAVKDKIPPAGPGAGCFRRVQLLQRNQGSFIGKVILPAFHDPHAQGRPVAGNGGGRHQPDFRIRKHLFLAPGRLGLGVFPQKRLHLFRGRVIHPAEFRPRFQKPVRHIVNVSVGKAHYPKNELAGPNRRLFQICTLHCAVLLSKWALFLID